MPTNFNWNATAFFLDLTARNKLAREHDFAFCRVSGLEGFEEALAHLQSDKAFVCVSDISHAIDDMAARQRCMESMRELFRQFMSKLILEQTKLQEHCIYLDPRISFQEIDRYFFSGCACAYFQIAVDTYTDLRYKEEEWDE